ncbi:hypothetical protein E1B28_000863 [Marasmius oreades]|uniref:DNA replication regulator SLD2 n=1 Tax=Marasmius oreades TaxID=181124 RepID=A0A9P7V273_9AGAR|nr:uncharacterized protein E1B28_000863 [Marasmius oreades]KAG7098976.1 hypothetical protein E1B28_000863 [Marasmius oreades]
MTDVASVRSEIKTWERSFKEEHGRHPSVEDVRNNPSIADKYRVYKKLTKALQNPALPKSGPVKQTVPLTSFNPFSPTKTKGKQKQPESPLQTKFWQSNNPFATPSKLTPNPRIREPSPSPALPHSAASISTSALKLPIAPLNAIPEPPDAVVRARKRLRGEPVSPSPNKDKRRRVHSSQQPFARRHSAESSSSGDDDDGIASSSFFDDSPMKAPSGCGSRAFKVLFEDKESLSATNKKLQAALGRARSNNSSTGLFGKAVKYTSSISFDDEMGWEDGTSAGKREPAASSKAITAKQRLRRWAPTKDNLNEPGQQGIREPPSKVNVAKKPPKRVAVSDASDDDRRQGSCSTSVKPILFPLLPPSPPPADSSSSNVPKNSALIKIKGKTNHKKAKLTAKDNEDEDEDNSASDTTRIKVVRPRSFTRGVTPHIGDDNTAGSDNEDMDSIDSDPILRYFQHARPNSGGGFTSFVSSEGEEDFAEDEDVDHFAEVEFDTTGRTRLSHHKKRDDTHGEGSVEVNLPDKLKDLLALSASDSRARDENLKQDLVVEKLLYGRRGGHYDGSRGGEIWEIGDVSGVDYEDDGNPLDFKHKRVEAKGEEDDWEGEPIPWEIGEL